MAVVTKVLGQVIPSAASLSTLYTVPALTTAVCSTLVVCNQSVTPTTFRVAVRVAGLSIESKQYLYYDVAIPGSETFTATLGITLGAADVVSVYATLATLSFNLFGQEI